MNAQSRCKAHTNKWTKVLYSICLFLWSPIQVLVGVDVFLPIIHVERVVKSESVTITTVEPLPDATLRVSIYDYNLLRFTPHRLNDTLTILRRWYFFDNQIMLASAHQRWIHVNLRTRRIGAPSNDELMDVFESLELALAENAIWQWRSVRFCGPGLSTSSR